MRCLEILPPAHTHTHAALSEMHSSLVNAEHCKVNWKDWNTELPDKFCFPQCDHLHLYRRICMSRHHPTRRSVKAITVPIACAQSLVSFWRSWALKTHSNTDWGKSTMNLGGIRKLTYCEFMTEITTNSRRRCVSEVYASTQHSSQTLSEFDSVYTSKFAARSHATLELSKTVQVRLLVTSLHQIKGFCRETHPLSRT